MLDDLKKKSEDAINRILKEGIATTNIDNLYKLIDIYKDAKEVKDMDYGRNPGFDSYGRYYDYGRRGYDMKYRGNEYIDRVAGEYGRYMENKSRYGANEETDRSFHYMVKALEDFIRVLHEEANTPQQKQQLNEALQHSMM